MGSLGGEGSPFQGSAEPVLALTRGGSGATRHPWSRFLFKDRLVFKTLPPTIKLIEPFFGAVLPFFLRRNPFENIKAIFPQRLPRLLLK
jgi:hypothetical protein